MLHPFVVLTFDLLQSHRLSIAVPQRGFEGFGQALARILAHAHAVDDDIHGVFVVFLELWEVVDIVSCAIDSHPCKALRAQLLEQIGLLEFGRIDTLTRALKARLGYAALEKAAALGKNIL